MISGACFGMELKLIEDHIEFGEVIVNSQI